MSLRILDKFQGLFEKFGIDYEIMRTILETKLILDIRRAPAIDNSNRKKDSENTSFIKGYLLHLIFGVFLAFFIYFIQDEMIRMIYFSGGFFFMTTMYLISDFSFVLLDTKDKNIIMTRPVDSRVVSLSKVLHILIYMFRLNAFIAGPSLVAIVMLNGAAAIPIFLLEILLMDLLIFLVTAFIYLLVLRFFDGEMLRNIINFIQILLTVLVAVGYQVAVRMIDFSELHNITYNFKFSNYFNPILWFGAPFEILFNGGREIYLYIFTILSVIVPLICFVIYLKLSKKMESLLLKLEGQGRERPSKHRLELLTGKILSRNETVRQSFYFANGVIRSDRNLKLKIYPSLATGIMVPVIMILNMGVRDQGFETIGYEYLLLYFNFLVIPTVLELTMYSSAWKGSYVYFISGFNSISELYRGVMQVVAVRLIVPMMIVNGVVFIAIFKERFIVDMAVLILASISALPFLGKIYFTDLPFSIPIDESNQKGSLRKLFMSIGVVVCYAVLHAASHKLPMGIWVYLGLLLVAVPIIWMFVIPEKAKNI